MLTRKGGPGRGSLPFAEENPLREGTMRGSVRLIRGGEVDVTSHVDASVGSVCQEGGAVDVR